MCTNGGWLISLRKYGDGLAATVGVASGIQRETPPASEGRLQHTDVRGRGGPFRSLWGLSLPGAPPAGLRPLWKFPIHRPCASPTTAGARVTSHTGYLIFVYLTFNIRQR